MITEALKPIERMAAHGPDCLADSELISMLLAPDPHALDKARRVLEVCEGNLFELGKLSSFELIARAGLSSRQALTVMAALNLGTRRAETSPPTKVTISTSSDIAQHLQYLRDDLVESFVVIFLNRANRITGKETISIGGLTGTIADPRVILKKALDRNAVSIILSHNHPSGNLKPSNADKELTTKIKEAAKYFDIKVLDHIIMSEDGYYSFADEGLI